MENRVRIQIFNQPVIDGRVYVAENKEFVENIFKKYLDNTKPLLLTDSNQERGFLDDHHDEDYYKKFSTVDLSTVAGKFEDIEIIETNEIGFGGVPIIEVWANLKILDNDRGKMVNSLFKEDVATFGMRSIVNCLPDNKKEITHVISYDLVSKKA